MAEWLAEPLVIRIFRKGLHGHPLSACRAQGLRRWETHTPWSS